MSRQEERAPGIVLAGRRRPGVREKIFHVMIYAAVGGVVYASFVIPELLLSNRQYRCEMLVYEEKKAENSLAVEAEEIYLVKLIHDLNSLETKMKVLYEYVSDDWTVFVTEEGETVKEASVAEAEKELEKLYEAGVLGYFQPTTGGEEYRVVIMNQIFQRGETEYLIREIDYHMGGRQISIVSEDKTGKVLGIQYEPGELEGKDKRELLENYIRYLELSVLDDWTPEGNWMISRKADLAVGFEGMGRELLGEKMENAGDKSVCLTVRPIEIMREEERISYSDSGTTEIYMWDER